MFSMQVFSSWKNLCGFNSLLSYGRSVSHRVLSVPSLFSSFTSAVCGRKAPPPVPPRITSKPLISVTVQSSTESAQDTYLDQQEPRSEANSQSGRSNSSDSLCSIRTGSLAKGTQPPAPVPASVPAPAAAPVPPVPAPREPPPTTTTTATSTQPQNDTVSTGFTLQQPAAEPKRKLSSIGIQVRFIHLCQGAL